MTAGEAVRTAARPALPGLYRGGQLTQIEKMPPAERAITLIVDGEELPSTARATRSMAARIRRASSGLAASRSG
jgi:hypothetical protein